MPGAGRAPGPHESGFVIAAAAVRGAVVAASGAILTAGLALIIWALTPTAGIDAVAAGHAGLIGFAAANLMPVVIGGITVTLPPLLLTLAVAFLLGSTVLRGRFLPQGRHQEAVAMFVTSGVYGLLVAVLCRGLGRADAVPAGGVWTAGVLALVATATGVLLSPQSAWRAWFLDVVPGRLRVGLRGAGVGLAGVLAGGALAVAAGLIGHFGSAVAVAAAAAPSWTDGAGMALLGVVYLPSAVLAAVGYLSGAGFEIGTGTYSPFVTSPADLPAVPLLAAAPEHAGRSWVGIAMLVVPLVVGFLVSRPIVRALSTRIDRIVAATLAAAVTGAVVGGMIAIARGGVGAGRWSTIGAPPLLTGFVVAVEVGAVAVAASVVAGGALRQSAPSAVEGANGASTAGGIDDTPTDEAPTDAASMDEPEPEPADDRAPKA